MAENSKNTDTSKLLETSLKYTQLQLANLDKESMTAAGTTDDMMEDKPSQVAMVIAGSTDSRDAANVLFRQKYRIPAENLAMGDYYDMTQAYTRINNVYAMSRDDYYAQYAQDMVYRQNRLKHKQKLIAEMLRYVEEPKKIYEKMLKENN